MKVFTQREAVFNAITTVMGTDSFEGAVSMSKEEKKQVYAILSEGFKAGSISFEATPANQEKLANASKLNTYVSGLVSNWLRKDERLNGNVKYEAKNPGSRAGSSDPQLKALRLLATKFKGTEKAAEIQKHIAARTQVVQAEKAQKAMATIDLSVLPADIVESLGLDQE